MFAQKVHICVQCCVVCLVCLRMCLCISERSHNTTHTHTDTHKLGGVNAHDARVCVFVYVVSVSVYENVHSLQINNVYTIQISHLLYTQQHTYEIYGIGMQLTLTESQA